MRSILIFLLIIGMAGAIGGPAGVVLQSEKLPVPTLCLSGVSSAVFNSSAFDNGDLGPSHYVWDRQDIKQTNAPSDLGLLNWSDEWIELPSSFVRN